MEWAVRQWKPARGERGSVAAFSRSLTAAGVRGGTSLASIYAYFRGAVQPTVDVVAAAANILHINPAWLAFGQGPREPARGAFEDVDYYLRHLVPGYSDLPDSLRAQMIDLAVEISGREEPDLEVGAVTLADALVAPLVVFGAQVEMDPDVYRDELIPQLFATYYGFALPLLQGLHSMLWREGNRPEITAHYVAAARAELRWASRAWEAVRSRHARLLQADLSEYGPEFTRDEVAGWFESTEEWRTQASRGAHGQSH